MTALSYYIDRSRLLYNICFLYSSSLSQVLNRPFANWPRVFFIVFGPIVVTNDLKSYHYLDPFLKTIFKFRMIFFIVFTSIVVTRVFNIIQLRYHYRSRSFVIVGVVHSIV